jgi:hypothetical protein
VTSGVVATSALSPNKQGTSAAVDISCVEEEVKMELEEVEEVVLTTSSTPHHDVPPAEAGHLPAYRVSPLLPALLGIRDFFVADPDPRIRTSD